MLTNDYSSGSAYNQESFRKKEIVKQNQLVIDEHLFVESLALTAFEVSYNNPQPSDSEKIILLLERMNHSEGPAKV